MEVQVLSAEVLFGSNLLNARCDAPTECTAHVFCIVHSDGSAEVPKTISCCSLQTTHVEPIFILLDDRSALLYLYSRAGCRM